MLSYRFITYPTEFVKTRSQFGGKRTSPLTIIKETVQTKGVLGLYSGCMALVIGNATKAGVRFLSYDHFKHMLADPQVRSRSLLLLRFSLKQMYQREESAHLVVW